MKALTFLQYKQLEEPQHMEYYWFIRHGFTHKIGDIDEFYSQPFTLELITKYFGGWKKCNENYCLPAGRRLRGVSDESRI